MWGENQNREPILHTMQRVLEWSNMSRKKKFVIAGLAVVVLVAGFLGYVALSHSGGDPLTVAELKAQGDSAVGRTIGVKGEVKHGSIEWDSQNQALSFALTDGQDTLDVVYRGVAPDSFEPGAEVALEGMYTESGLFEAQSFSSTGSLLCNTCH